MLLGEQIQKPVWRRILSHQPQDTVGTNSAPAPVHYTHTPRCQTAPKTRQGARHPRTRDNKPRRLWAHRFPQTKLGCAIVKRHLTVRLALDVHEQRRDPESRVAAVWRRPTHPENLAPPFGKR
ncbi:unnamed protein product, partial [Iphiclides podalirius]